MIKKITVAFVLFAALAVNVEAARAASLTAESRISKVTVYPSLALVTRTFSGKLAAGESDLIFPDIIPAIDENSLKVEAQGNADVRILGAEVKKEFLEEHPSDRVKQLQDDLQKSYDQRNHLEGLKVANAEEKGFLDSIRLFSADQVPKDLVTRMPQAKDLEETLKLLGAKLRENFSQKEDTDIQIRELDKKIASLQQELNQIAGSRQKIKRSIVVQLDVRKAGEALIDVSYLVGAASWAPLYDARADLEKSEVELALNALVRQSTGEDWKNVALSLSTAKPAVGGRLPEVQSWIVRFYQRQAARQRMAKNKADMPLEFFDEEDKGLAGSVMPAKSQEMVAPSAPIATAESKGVAVVYNLTRPADIKADGSESKLAVLAQKLKSDFEYSLYPRAVLSAYLGSKVTNGNEMQLLAGRVNVFLSGDFVGVSGIDNVGPGEKFDLYLGADENIKVKRDQIEKKIDETIVAGIPSPNKTITITNKLTVENYKTVRSKFKLFESMPVAQEDRIKVKILKVSLEPTKKDWEDRLGVWLWEFELDPKAKQEITYTYSVEFPRQMQVEGL